MKKPTKVWLIVVAAVVSLLVLVQIIGSPIATRYVNGRLVEMPKYTGHVAYVSLALWRGTIQVHDGMIKDRGDPQGAPLVSVAKLSLTVAPSALLRGHLGGRGHISKLVVHIKADPPDEDEKKEPSPGAQREWQRILQQTFPLEITRFEISDGAVVFEDPYKKPVAKIALDQLSLVTTDFSNRPQSGEAMPTSLKLTARLGGTGKLDVEAKVDPSAPSPKFFAKMDVQGLQLVPIHDFIAAYALIDVKAGEFSVYSEVNAENGHYAGYVKPFFKDLQFEAIPDPEKNVIQRAASTVASGVVELLKNEKDQVATRAPFEGDFATNDVGVWTTVENLLRNAFVQSLREGLEGQTP